MDTETNNDKRNWIIGGVLGLIIVAVILWLVFGLGGDGDRGQEVAEGRPINVTLDFYESWVDALRAEDTNPWEVGLAEAPILSAELRERLTSTKGGTETGVDPVLCQREVPEQLSARPVFQNESEAQVLVLAGDTKTGEQAIVTLGSLRGGWFIKNIECSSGETAPDREFSFEKEGFLLKDSVPPPLDSRFWHLVFEENGQKGHTAPLFFDGESMCGGSVCNSDNFSEATKVFVQGQLSETGVQVKRLESRE